ncbi:MULTISPECIES: hypothetical protein [Thermoanaerobacterium]|jgi:hypothetical protein|uniref:PIR Superfamily Protein n=1 Tax=Thermoanaerobacterium butyriciformans TaxID=1702242 RepID=A0ABS4NE65_9THEO|nr:MULTISPECIES: hypothetical protein [Thermoanaerobacterium]MBP2071930.1 hypothetical protein [Thermoanaerobacterium butyriciformans]MDK2806147.1 hypothetical protein [Thermoanaerobacterium sp.]WKV07924.1 hypothetical protein Q2T46_10160 [Thermoanaerobacterium sp. CMT5567-10]
MSLNSRFSEIYNSNYEFFDVYANIDKILSTYSKSKMTEKSDEYIDIYNDFYCYYNSGIDENKSSDEKK